jgi:pyroglutamyl-peptidase
VEELQRESEIVSLLITAFSRFDGGPNCSERLVEKLQLEKRALASLWGGPVAFATLEVDAEGVEAAFAEAVAKARPTHVLLMGQAASREKLTFERVAANRRDFGVPDACGRIGFIGPVRDQGPERRGTTWPDLEGAAAAVSAEGVPAAVSDDAGTHLCNQTLYLALEAGERADPRFVATFLHLPLLPEQIEAAIPQAAGRGGFAGMKLDDMARAVRAFLVHTRRAIHRRQISHQSNESLA